MGRTIRKVDRGLKGRQEDLPFRRGKENGGMKMMTKVRWGKEEDGCDRDKKETEMKERRRKKR